MLVDAHAHCDRFGDRTDQAIAQMNHYRILTLGVAMDIPSYLKTVGLAARSPYLKATFGIHPWEARHYGERLGELDPYLRQTPLIGEAGLDFFWVEDKTTFPCQRKVFEYQCEWAARTGKIMNLHTKGAETDVLSAIRELRLKSPIIHWYSGPLGLIDAYLSCGCYFTVGVETLVSEEARRIARAIPFERLLLETDNPGGYEWLIKIVGMPRLIRDVLGAVAGAKGVGAAQLEACLTDSWVALTSGIPELAAPG